MANSRDEYKIKAMKLAISKVGDYSSYVSFHIEHDPAEMVCYKISAEVPEEASNKLTKVIEREGNRLGVHVSQIL